MGSSCIDCNNCVDKEKNKMKNIFQAISDEGIIPEIKIGIPTFSVKQYHYDTVVRLIRTRKDLSKLQELQIANKLGVHARELEMIKKGLPGECKTESHQEGLFFTYGKMTQDFITELAVDYFEAVRKVLEKLKSDYMDEYTKTEYEKIPDDPVYCWLTGIRNRHLSSFKEDVISFIGSKNNKLIFSKALKDFVMNLPSRADKRITSVLEKNGRIPTDIEELEKRINEIQNSLPEDLKYAKEPPTISIPFSDLGEAIKAFTLIKKHDLAPEKIEIAANHLYAAESCGMLARDIKRALVCLNAVLSLDIEVPLDGNKDIVRAIKSKIGADLRKNEQKKGTKKKPKTAPSSKKKVKKKVKKTAKTKKPGLKQKKKVKTNFIIPK